MSDKSLFTEDAEPCDNCRFTSGTCLKWRKTKGHPCCHNCQHAYMTTEHKRDSAGVLKALAREKAHTMTPTCRGGQYLHGESDRLHTQKCLFNEMLILSFGAAVLDAVFELAKGDTAQKPAMSWEVRWKIEALKKDLMGGNDR